MSPRALERCKTRRRTDDGISSALNPLGNALDEVGEERHGGREQGKGVVIIPLFY